MGNNRSNEYCEACKKFHRKGKCSEISKKDVADASLDVIMSMMDKSMRYSGRKYPTFIRNCFGDDNKFADSDIVKEVDSDESGRSKEENK